MQIIQPDAPKQKKSFLDIFTAAPHRMMFFAGAIQLLLPVFFWSIELIGLHSDLWRPLDISFPSSWLHGFIMLYGVFIFFMFGFLMTTFPRWMNGPLVEKSAYISTFIWCSVGISLFQYGIFYSVFLAVSGLGIFLFGWALGIFSLFKVYRAAASPDKQYETLLLFMLLAGWLGAANFLIWLLTDDWFFIQISINTGLWLFLIPVLFTVSHRMLPFFSSNVIGHYQIYQPRWMPVSILILGIIHMQLSLNNLYQWTFISDIPMALIGFYLSYKWRLKDSLINGLLAVLHLSFIWFAIGMTLFSIQSLVLLSTETLILAKAPIHALTIGFVASMLVAMASRVTLGHSGRPLHANRLTISLFIGLQLTAVVRILADIPALSEIYGLHLYIISALAWLVCLGSWFIIYAPMYLSRRADGRPG